MEIQANEPILIQSDRFDLSSKFDGDRPAYIITCFALRNHEMVSSSLFSSSPCQIAGQTAAVPWKSIGFIMSCGSRNSCANCTCGKDQGATAGAHAADIEDSHAELLALRDRMKQLEKALEESKNGSNNSDVKANEGSGKKAKRNSFRSAKWFNIEDDPGMTALYLERYLNYGLTREELMTGKPIIGLANSGSDLSPCNRFVGFSFWSKKASQVTQISRLQGTTSNWRSACAKASDLRVVFVLSSRLILSRRVRVGLQLHLVNNCVDV